VPFFSERSEERCIVRKQIGTQAMGIVCPECGQASRDLEFCDHCNRDLNGPPAAPPVPNCCPLSAAGIELTPEQQAALTRPEASLLIEADGAWQRIHWIDREALPLWSARLRERIAKNSLRCLPEARLVEEDAGAWMMVDAVPPFPSDRAPEKGAGPWAARLDDPQDECERLLRYFALLTDSVEELHEHGLVWLTFHPLHLEQFIDRDSGRDRLRFTNLDLGVYPAGECPERLHVKINFAAPEITRYQAEEIGPRTDVFHMALFAYYWLAGLLPSGFPGEGLEAIWYQVPKLRIYAPRIPPGIAGVLARGMALDSAARFATPRALAAALEGAVQANRGRLDFQGKVRWDLGGDTRTGRTKAALGKDNEDRVLVLPFERPPRALLAVADGITTCDVGSGALASLILSIVLENIFDADSTQETFAPRIAKACDQGARTLLAWAVEKGYLDQLQEGADLMGTTLTAGWLEGNVLSLANLGDSRAYLVGPAWVEQLTVDGDLASGMLAGGMPPETIRDVGQIAKALRECIGGCTFNAAGEITILEECCNPAVTQWPLLPGDVVVLCSDGLVEEGTFMEPETLGELVRANRHLPARGLAKHLVQAADNLHRLPSALEPDGYGDNISCIVIKIDEEG
ncbi:MAG TPA: PP2C family serine/threonine-protein phosphatase, partial [Gemmataceae bacterium]|nr:PP2C family serine/threonine-protein phosphatase [Gemmataceae bacterium]